jgi:hypothetical protein
MMQQALTLFFSVLLIIFLFMFTLNSMLDYLVTGVIGKGHEGFTSEITGTKTEDEMPRGVEEDEDQLCGVNKKTKLILHDEKGYDQLNFQVANNMPLSQATYANYINKYYINQKINTSVDSDMEIHGKINLQKPDFYYDGVWKPDYKNQGDYQKVTWSLSKKDVSSSRGKLGVDKLLEQVSLKPMPEEMKYKMCDTNTMPFNDFDRICHKESMDECSTEYKTDDMVCFQPILDPMIR